jgi:hypothetical protein
MKTRTYYPHADLYQPPSSQAAWTCGLRRTRLRFLTVLIALTGVSVVVVRAAAHDADDHGKPQLIEFEVPGAATEISAQCGAICGTQALANNNEGTVIGFYTDENVVPHGFLRTRAGRITSFDAPGAGLGSLLDQGTVPYSINDEGTIAGQYQDPNNVFHAFIRYPGGSFESFDAPDAGTTGFSGTLAYSINAKRDTAGVFVDSGGVQHGFVRQHGELAEFDPPGSVFTMVCEETCLNDSGAATGFYVDANGTAHGFLRLADGTVQSFDAPNSSGTIAASITNEGEIAGYVVDADNVAHGFIRNRNATFAKDIDVPQAFTGPGGGTAVFAIDASEVTIGAYSDTSLANHGFARSRDARFAYFDAPGAGGGANQGTRPSTNNSQGEVAGWWVDPSGLNHAFIWQPEHPQEDAERSR